MSDRARRWASWTAVAIVAALVCGLLGAWQFSRYESKAENIARVEANFNAPPRPLGEVVAGGLATADEWTPVELTGRFVGDPVILPQRGVPGQAGDHVLTLFLTTDERTVVVDRGWYPVSHPPASLAPPEGTLTLTARARPAEPASPRGVREHQVFAVDPAQVIAAQGGAEVPNVEASAYFMAAAGEAGQEGLGSFPEPAPDLGNHLSYAFQWWIFAVGAFVGLGVVIRRDLKSATPTPTRRRVSRDIAEEDALIDAQLQDGGRPGP